jgi:hypothetical protein
VVAGFDGGVIDLGHRSAVVGGTERAIGLIEEFARSFSDRRAAEQVEHTVTTMVGQRVFGIALGYEHPIDRDQLRHDPIMAVLAAN